MRLLLTEDDPDLAHSLRLSLADAGHNVVFKHGTGNVFCPGGFDVTRWKQVKGDLLATVERTAGGAPLRVAAVTSSDRPIREAEH